MKMTNNEIYTYATQLMSAFQDTEQKFPVKVNFYFLKNKKLLLDLAREIEQSRSAILEEHGVLNTETNQYEFAPEKIEIVNTELTNLFTLEQEVNIYKVKIDSFNDADTLTTAQMEALMFMIED
jgi:hypothetical protein